MRRSPFARWTVSGDLGQALQRDVGENRETQRQESCRRGFGPRGPQRGVSACALGYKVTILEKSPKAGGLNRGGIPDWVLPQDVLDREVERLIELGIAIKTNTEVEKDVSWDSLKKEYDAVVLAVGLTEPKQRSRRRRKQASVILRTSLPARHRHGHIESEAGRRVAVIGGGNTAIDCAREALRQGAVEVT